MIKNLIALLNDGGYDCSVKGFINVEGGHVALATSFFNSCGCYGMAVGPKANMCPDCGRANGNWVELPAGDGDGVYVVASINRFGNPGSVVGAFVIFDYKYGIANAVRKDIAEERVPRFPIEILQNISASKYANLGRFAHKGTLLVGDSSLSANSRNAIVDVNFPPTSELQCLAFFEEVSPEPESWKNRLSATQGMDPEEVGRALLRGIGAGTEAFRLAGRSEGFQLPDLIPRCVLVLDPTGVADLGLTQEPIEIDWEKYALQASAAVNTAHKTPQEEMTIWQNALLAREVDRAAGDVTDAEAKELLFDMWTWCFQGSYFGDNDCTKVIKANSYVCTPQEEADLYIRRGLFEAAEKALSSQNHNSLGASALPKNSPGL